MNKNILIILCCFLSLTAWAQNETDNNRRVLPNYEHEIKLEVSNGQLKIQEKEKLDSFALNENLQLRNLVDTSAILNALHFEESQLTDLYGQYVMADSNTQTNLLNALIKRATELEGQRIIFSGKGESIPIEEPMYTPETEVDESKLDYTFWLSILGGVLGGLLLGLFFGMRMNKEPIPVNTNLGQSKEDILLTKTKNELADIKTSLQQQLDFDQQYFKQSFNSIIVPLENALEARDLKAITPLLIKAMAHYTAVTRFKLEKKQSFDLANMQMLMGSTTYQKSDFPRIDKNTSPDDIPNKLKALIELLKNAQADGVEESIVAGYKIEKL